MPRQRFDRVDGPRAGRGGLYLEPLVHHQMVVAVGLLEGCQRRPGRCRAALAVRQNGESGRAIGHVGRRLELSCRQSGGAGLGGKVVEQHVAQGTAPGARCVGAEWTLAVQSVVD